MMQGDMGVVVIGRNEGQRLHACLASLPNVAARVYVDSGSTDGSCELARDMGIAVVSLAIPPGFTAARARNTGIEHLLAHHSDLAYIQTVDGDCELRTGWLEAAYADLETDPRRAVAFGRRRERYPRANAYHAACDDEWNVALGEVTSCGGDALFRITAFCEVGGYNPALIAGEEPDLCLRLRQNGWRIWSNGREMTWHDVAIGRMAQWWRRSRRTGFAFAELVDLHRVDADPGWHRLLHSALGWSGVAFAALLIAFVATALHSRPAAEGALLLAALPAAQLIRLALRQRRRAESLGASLQWAWLIMVAKAAQATGWAQYQIQHVTRARAPIIEYKR